MNNSTDTLFVIDGQAKRKYPAPNKKGANMNTTSG